MRHSQVISGNNMKTGIILVHGFTGSSDDLKPLVGMLINKYGNHSVKNIVLPGHDNKGVPEFDEDRFTKNILKEIEIFRKENRKIVIIGHSTGGNMVLSCMQKNEYCPDMLILAGVPFRVDKDAYTRWNNHREGKSPVPFSSIAKMVSIINRTGRAKYVSDHMYALIISNVRLDNCMN